MILISKDLCKSLWVNFNFGAQYTKFFVKNNYSEQNILLSWKLDKTSFKAFDVKVLDIGVAASVG